MEHRTRRIAPVLLTGLAQLTVLVGQAGATDSQAEAKRANPDRQQSSDLAPWRMYRHDVRHTGRSPVIGVQTAGIKWSYAVDTRPYPVAVLSSPAIATDGTIYVGSLNNSFLALDADGHVKWSYKTRAFVDSSPAIGQDGTVYFTAYDGFLHALHPDGTLRWRYRIGLTANSPTLGWDDTVYIASAKRLYALSPDGTYKWSHGTNGIFRSSPAVGQDGTVYIGSDGWIRDEPPDRQRSSFYALNPDGTLQWRFSTGFTRTSSPALGNGNIYFGTKAGFLYALNPDGKLKWRHDAEGAVYSSPAIGSDGSIYLSAGYNVRALNPDGTLKWKSAASAGVFFYSSPAIDGNGSLYVGSDYDFHALNADGSQKWIYHSVPGFYSSPAIGQDGTVYIKSSVPGGSGVGYLYAFGSSPTSADLRFRSGP